MSDLKPCPKCGNADEVSVQFYEDDDGVAANFVCDKCGLEGATSPKMLEEYKAEDEAERLCQEIPRAASRPPHAG